MRHNEYYTAGWWQEKSGLNSIQKTAMRLTKLARKDVVKKVSADRNEVVRFMPTAMFCENDIVAMLKEMQFVKTL